MSAPRNPAAALALAFAALAFSTLVLSVTIARATPADSALVAPYISLRIDPPFPCATDSVSVAVTDSCGPCMWTLSGWAPAPDDARAFFRLAPASVCAANPCEPKGFLIRLGPRPAGLQHVDVTITVQVPEDSLNAPRTFSFRKSIAYAVTDTCRMVPPVPVGPLPFVTHVTLAGATTPCDTCPPHVCANLPVHVLVGGYLPSPCYVYRGARLIPFMNPVDPPTVVLDFAITCGVPCAQHTVPWSGEFTIPASAAGPHVFDLGVAVNACPDTVKRLGVHRVFPFVTDSCWIMPPTLGCVNPDMIAVPVLGYLSDGCNLKLSPLGAGGQAFAVRSDSIALAGLQGTVRASAGLHIAALTPTGRAQYMHVVTQGLGTGEVGFVLYGDGGSTIPANDFGAVLVASVRADSTLHAGDHGTIGVRVTGASDSTGGAVPVCTIETFAPVVANVCIVSTATCDANGDGFVNVADLVRMARCWLHPETCPDTTGARPDCNDDGAFGVADILCCARAILGGGRPDTTHTAAGLVLAFGAPTLEQGVVHVNLNVSGASAMNGALLHVRFPADRYAFVPGADPAPSKGAGVTTSWLPLTESGDGDVVIGVLRLDDAAPDQLSVPLAFRVLDGQVSGGALTADQAQVIAPDGSQLTVNLGSMTANLPAGTAGTFARIELLCGPNPSSGPTQFAVRLPAAAQVDLGLYDVAGRRVDTVFRGSLAAGETRLAWQPHGAHGGVYFARLAVNGVVRTMRLTLRTGP